jgi:hypothetical protein
MAALLQSDFNDCPRLLDRSSTAILMHAAESDENREVQECKGDFGDSGMDLPG